MIVVPQTIPAAAFGLGCWQVARLQWKLSLLKHLEKRLNDPAVDFPINEYVPFISILLRFGGR